VIRLKKIILSLFLILFTIELGLLAFGTYKYIKTRSQFDGFLQMLQLQFKEYGSIDLPDTNLDTIGNPQGVSFDGTYLYVSYRRHLYKILLTTGSIVSEIDTTTMGTFGDGNGDLQYYNGFLYVCNSNFRTGGIDGKVSKYNADGLSFVQEYSLPVKNVPSTITQKDGYFWVIRYTSPTTLQKYSLDFTQLLDEYTLGNNAGDGVTWIGNYLLINQHEVSDGNIEWGNAYLYYFRDNSFKLVNTIQKHDLWGQGIHFDQASNTLFIVKRGYTKSKNKIIFSNITFK
jgi:hypothetical protein